MSTALVLVTPVAEEAPAGRLGSRASAHFIAHLIATSAQMPQTRARRRAEPKDAVVAYGSLGQWPIPPGGMLSRTF